MRAVLALALVGCGFSVPANGSDDEPSRDGSIDQPLDACVSFSSQLDTCGKTGVPLTISGVNTLDTDTGVMMNGNATVALTSAVVVASTNQIELRVIYASTVMFAANAQLRAVGSRPLAIIAFGNVSLAAGALIDVGAGGAGAFTMCPNGAARGENDSGGGGGGGGGSFAALGGKGGDGNSDGGGSTGGTAGAVVALPAGPRGGCPGSGGGNGDQDGGEGGPAGGALYIASATQIELLGTAAITAGGGGGGGGRQSGFSNGDAGGGGGGSGGLILLEAPKVRSTGVLAANGGGGGEGSGNGDAGNPGARGPASTLRAEGGKMGSPTGTDGGRGGAVAAVTGESPGAAQAGGAGGGGGGAGYIKVASPDRVLGTVSPAVTP
ncbi:MAG: hypothetical protein H0T46_31885 [Deltaproteobacteria bacterium]|nr:hypothetical protein [Deltaproteobacteria bacterium]